MKQFCTKRRVKAGKRQRSALAPMLYNIYINGSPKETRQDVCLHVHGQHSTPDKNILIERNPRGGKLSIKIENWG